MKVNINAWKDWYAGKEEIVDNDMPRLWKIFKAKGVSKILDLGCGTGRHVIYLAEKGFDVYGFDFSEYAIQRSKERLKNRNLASKLIVWDMSKKLPYENGFFDAIVAVRVIHHAKILVIKHVISEINRMLRKAGYFYAQVPTFERHLEYRKRRTEGKLIESGTWIPLEGAEKGVPHHGFRKPELLGVLEDFGFEIERIRTVDGHYDLLATKRFSNEI